MGDGDGGRGTLRYGVSCAIDRLIGPLPRSFLNLEADLLQGLVELGSLKPTERTFRVVDGLDRRERTVLVKGRRDRDP